MRLARGSDCVCKPGDLTNDAATHWRRFSFKGGAQFRWLAMSMPDSGFADCPLEKLVPDPAPSGFRMIAL